MHVGGHQIALAFSRVVKNFGWHHRVFGREMKSTFENEKGLGRSSVFCFVMPCALGSMFFDCLDSVFNNWVEEQSPRTF